MLLNFTGDISSLQEGIDILKLELSFDAGAWGIPVLAERRPGNLEVLYNGGTGSIKYGEKVHFFRGLGLFLEAMEHGTDFYITEEPQFQKNGIMLDASRNAVMRTEALKELIKRLALMGLNLVMLYTEDTYAIDNRPYFGYMRGRYTYGELKECDDYSDIFGIEMVPCIQTLSHLRTALRWAWSEPVRDTADTLLVGEEETYEFIDDMIRSASAPFRSRRIHIGMDEACDLGLGSYLDRNGFRGRFDIMAEHLGRVLEITGKYGLEPMMWSDMYFRLASEKHIYCDPEVTIPEAVINSVPEEVGLVYWDYGNTETEMYEKMIRKHRMFRSRTIFAGGIHIWSGCGINYGKTFKATKAALDACRKEAVSEVVATAWMDNGAENNAFSTLLGLQLFAELGYAREYDEEKLKRRFRFCTGCDFDAFMDLRLLDEVPGNTGSNLAECNPSKYLLWQDVLLGIFDRMAEGLDLGNHYSALAEKYERYAGSNGEFGFVFLVPMKLAKVLGIKAEAGLRLKELYDRKDRKGLEEMMLEVLPELSNGVDALMQEHRRQWFRIYKAAGWEVLNIRYCGLKGRIDHAIERIKDYLEGKADRIEELEEERLPFQAQAGFVRFNSYTDTATACYF